MLVERQLAKDLLNKIHLKWGSPMRANEFLKEAMDIADEENAEETENVSESASAGATGAGAIASVASPLGSGETLRRSVYGEQPKKSRKKKAKS